MPNENKKTVNEIADEIKEKLNSLRPEELVDMDKLQKKANEERKLIRDMLNKDE